MVFSFLLFFTFVIFVKRLKKLTPALTNAIDFPLASLLMPTMLFALRFVPIALGRYICLSSAVKVTITE